MSKTKRTTAEELPADTPADPPATPGTAGRNPPRQPGEPSIPATQPAATEE